MDRQAAVPWYMSHDRKTLFLYLKYISLRALKSHYNITSGIISLRITALFLHVIEWELFIEIIKTVTNTV